MQSESLVKKGNANQCEDKQSERYQARHCFLFLCLITVTDLTFNFEWGDVTFKLKTYICVSYFRYLGKLRGMKILTEEYWSSPDVPAAWTQVRTLQESLLHESTCFGSCPREVLIWAKYLLLISVIQNFHGMFKSLETWGPSVTLAICW